MEVFKLWVKLECTMLIIPHQPPQPSLCPAVLLSASGSPGVSQGLLWQSKMNVQNNMIRREAEERSHYRRQCCDWQSLENSNWTLLWCCFWGGGAVGEVACRPPAGQFSCWGDLSPVPWLVSLSEWPAPWWGSRSEPGGSTQCVLVSKRKSTGTASQCTYK